MSGAGGHPFLAIPGPSIMPERVLRAMHRASPNIYEGTLPDMLPGITRDLCRVARTKGHVAIYIGNGHGAWEAALANIAGPGDRVLVLATGRFGNGWAEMAEGLGIVAEKLDFGRHSAVDAQAVEDALRADKAHEIKAVLVCHVDTSSSVLNDVAAVRAAMDAVGHPALLAADCIASLACDRFEMDGWGVDVMVAACQKGLMVPPGVSFVFFNDKADAVRDGMARVSRYWDWRPRSRPEMFYQYFAGTAPTHHLFGLREALDMLTEEGLEAVWARHERLAGAVWAACEAWGAEGPLRLNIAERAQRSRAVTSVAVGKPLGADLRAWVEAEMGLTLGIGLGMETPEDPKSSGFFRIGHMGHLNGQAVLGVLGVIEAGLHGLEIPHGPGGLSAAAKALSGQ